MLTLLLILMLKWNHMEKSRSPDFMVVLLAQAQASTTAQVLWPKVAPFCFASSICFTKRYWKLHMFLLQRTLGWMGMHAKWIEKAPGFSSLHEWCALGEDLAPCRPWQKALIAMSSAMEWKHGNRSLWCVWASMSFPAWLYNDINDPWDCRRTGNQNYTVIIS